MKDSEFIELLNLYLDHEISAADAARLEAEVQGNVERRRVYEQYCRMQKGCKMLARDFTTDAVPGPHGADKKVVAFDVAAVEAAAARRKRVGNLYTVGTFAAAAACVAIVFVGRSRQQASEAASLAASLAATTEAAHSVANGATSNVEAADIARLTPAVIEGGASSVGPRSLGGNALAAALKPSATTLMPESLSLTRHTQADALMTAAVQETNAQFAWMHNVQLTPIQPALPLTELRFETPATLRPEGRALGNRAPAQIDASVEMTAFRFAR
jgi:hypothetical protein